MFTCLLGCYASSTILLVPKPFGGRWRITYVTCHLHLEQNDRKNGAGTDTEMSYHTKLSLEKKILPPLPLSGLESVALPLSHPRSQTFMFMIMSMYETTFITKHVTRLDKKTRNSLSRNRYYLIPPILILL